MILHRPSVTHFLMVLATICEELPRDGIMLLYLSAKGGPEPDVPLSGPKTMPTTDDDDITESFSNLDTSSQVTSPYESPRHALSVNKENNKVKSTKGGLWFGTRGSGGGLLCILK